MEQSVFDYEIMLQWERYALLHDLFCFAVKANDYILTGGNV